MNLDHLRYFVAVSKTQHIGRAAAQLHVSSSAVSHSIRKLEAQLGRRLFQKIGKNITLTDFGKQFADRGTSLLNQADGLLHEFRSGDLPLNGTLKIAASHGLANHLIASSLAKLQINHPGLLFETYSFRSAEVIEQVARGQADVGICFSPTPHPAVTVHTTRPHPLAVCVRDGHPARKFRNAKLPQELSRLPCASPKAFSGVEICEDHPSLKKVGIRSNVAFVFDSYDVAAAYLRANDAWCLMPKSLAGILGLVPLKIDGLRANASIAIIVPKGRVLAPAVAEALCSVL